MEKEVDKFKLSVIVFVSNLGIVYRSFTNSRMSLEIPFASDPKIQIPIFWG